MRTNILPSIDYEDVKGCQGESLFSIWENGGASPVPAPLSVRRQRYRRLIVELVKCHGLAPFARILSLGAGNGFTEAQLAAAGFNVLATDRSEIALRYCRDKGLRTARIEFPEECSPELTDFDMIYCDGLFGHLWRPDVGYRRCWSSLAGCGNKHALLLLSNDLADTDEAPTLQVTGCTEAKFFRPPAGWFANDAEASKLWRLETVRMLHYRRHKQRRREILLLRRSLVYEREK